VPVDHDLNFALRGMPDLWVPIYVNWVSVLRAWSYEAGRDGNWRHEYEILLTIVAG